MITKTQPPRAYTLLLLASARWFLLADLY